MYTINGVKRPNSLLWSVMKNVWMLQWETGGLWCESTGSTRTFTPNHFRTNSYSILWVMLRLLLVYLFMDRLMDPSSLLHQCIPLFCPDTHRLTWKTLHTCYSVVLQWGPTSTHIWDKCHGSPCVWERVGARGWTTIPVCHDQSIDRLDCTQVIFNSCQNKNKSIQNNNTIKKTSPSTIIIIVSFLKVRLPISIKRLCAWFHIFS